jgi:hypothetical protein
MDTRGRSYTEQGSHISHQASDVANVDRSRNIRNTTSSNKKRLAWACGKEDLGDGSESSKLQVSEESARCISSMNNWRKPFGVMRKVTGFISYNSYLLLAV